MTQRLCRFGISHCTRSPNTIFVTRFLNANVVTCFRFDRHEISQYKFFCFKRKNLG